MAVDRKTLYKQKLSESRAKLHSLITSLNDDQLHATVIGEDQTWTVLDIVAHLVENERGMSIHIHKIRNGQETVPADFNLDRWNAGLKERMGNPSLQELLDDMNKVRIRTLRELETLTDEEWNLQGRHPSRGVITIEQYYETISGHDMVHEDNIREALGLQS